MKKNSFENKIDLFKKFYKLPDRKPFIQIFYECLHLTFFYLTLPKHYFGRYLFKRGKINITDYIPSKRLGKIKKFFNDKSVAIVLENKLYFNFYYGQFNLNLPKVLIYNHLNVFIKDNKVIKIENADVFCDVLKELIESNNLDSIFIKPTYGTYGGYGIYKIQTHQLLTDQKKIEELFPLIIKSAYLFQETIEQHPEMNKLNPSCLNTIRMDTFIDSKGNVEIISSFLRISGTNSMWITSHDYSVHIDIKTGNLHSEGYLEIKMDGGETIQEQPITKVKFNGFTIPYFTEAKQLIINAAKYMPGLRLIGWDIGIGTNGPVLIEGNFDYEIASNDMAAGGYLSNPVFRKAWNEYLSKQ